MTPAILGTNALSDAPATCTASAKNRNGIIWFDTSPTAPPNIDPAITAVVATPDATPKTFPARLPLVFGEETMFAPFDASVACETSSVTEASFFLAAVSTSIADVF